MVGRPSISLVPYKDTIIAKFQDGTSAAAISEFLFHNFQIRVEQKTIRRRLREWGITRRTKVDDTPQLRARIAILFYNCCLSDKNILNILQQEGYSISSWSLIRIRKEMGIKRRIEPQNLEEADRELLGLVQKELDKGGIEGLGRGNLYAYFRTNMQIASR